MQKANTAGDMEVKVRPGTPKDADAAGRLFQAHLNWINVWYDPDEVVQRESAVERIRALFRDEYPTSVAIAHEVVVGFAVSERRDPYILELFNLYVDDPYRRKGVGGKLVSSVEEQAIDRGAHTIIATASSYYFPGKALPEGLYRKLGWEIHDIAQGAQLYVKKLVPDPPAKKKRSVKRLRLEPSGELKSEDS